MGSLNNYEDYKKATYEAARLYNGGDFKGALAAFLALSKANFENIRVHETLSYIYLKLNRVDLAEKEYKIALEIARKNNKFVHP